MADQEERNRPKAKLVGLKLVSRDIGLLLKWNLSSSLRCGMC